VADAVKVSLFRRLVLPLIVAVMAAAAPGSAAPRARAAGRSQVRAKGRAKAQPPRRIRRNHLVLQGGGERATVDLIWENPKNRNEKRILKTARARMAHMLRDRRTGRTPRLPDRLLWYLYIVGFHYDRPIEVVSGLRQNARATSRHHNGLAVDFRVEGVDAREVWAYCKSRFAKVGLGWYPASRFVHMDVRDRAYYWIDDSGPGEPARYRTEVAQPVGQWQAERERERRQRSRGARVASK
jgi:hypothetical protein